MCKALSLRWLTLCRSYMADAASVRARFPGHNELRLQVCGLIDRALSFSMRSTYLWIDSGP